MIIMNSSPRPARARPSVRPIDVWPRSTSTGPRFGNRLGSGDSLLADVPSDGVSVSAAPEGKAKAKHYCTARSYSSNPPLLRRAGEGPEPRQKLLRTNERKASEQATYRFGVLATSLQTQRRNRQHQHHTPLTMYVA